MHGEQNIKKSVRISYCLLQHGTRVCFCLEEGGSTLVQVFDDILQGYSVCRPDREHFYIHCLYNFISHGKQYIPSF